MAPKTLSGFISWEHGGLWAAATDTGSNGYTAVGSAISIVQNQYGRPGRQWRYDSSGDIAGYRVAIGGSDWGLNDGYTIARLYFAASALPAIDDHTLVLALSAGDIALTTRAAAVRIRPDGKLEAGFTKNYNEKKRITTTGSPTGGTFTLTFDGLTTGTIAWNASAATVQAALEALSNIAPGDVVVTGGPLPATPIDIEFTGAYARQDVPGMTDDETLLTPGTSTLTVSTIQVGGGHGRVWHGEFEGGGVLSDVTISAGQWFRVDAMVDVTGTTWVMKWEVDLLDGAGPHVQAETTRVGTAAQVWNMTTVHYDGGQDGPAHNQVSYSDDLAVAYLEAEYPIGPGRTLPIFVTGYGTNVGESQFTQGDGSAIDVDSWHNVADDIPPFVDNTSEAGANDGKSLRLVNPFTSSNVLEFVFTQFSLSDIPTTADVSAVNFWGLRYASGSFPNIASRLDSYVAGVQTRQTDFYTSNTTVRAGGWGTSGGANRQVTPPAGGWTRGALNALTLRWHAASSGTGGTGVRYFGIAGLMGEVHITAPTEAALSEAVPASFSRTPSDTLTFTDSAARFELPPALFISRGVSDSLDFLDTVGAQWAPKQISQGLVLSELASSLLRDLPPYEADDVRVQNVLNAVARELARIEARAVDITWRLYPQNADDQWRTLGMWESLLGLPIEPGGDSTEEGRRAAVLASLRSRNASSGAHWVELMTTALGTSAWTHTEGPADYTIIIYVLPGAGGYATGVARRVARSITPAHLAIEAGTMGGFLVGISSIGDVL